MKISNEGEMEEVFYLYLAGPITGISYRDSTDWRKYVAKKLPPQIKVISPLRGKTYLRTKKQIKTSYENIPLSSAKGIASRDRFDTMRCDALLVNLLGAKKVSIGSVLEIGWADAFRKPIILAIEKEGNPHDHAELKEVANFIVDNLDEAIELAIKILLPGV